MALAVVVMTLAMAQAMAPETPLTVTESAATSAPPANDSTVSGVVVTPKAKEPPKTVYTPSYKAAPHLAPGATSIGGSTTIDQMFSPEHGPRYHSSHWATYSLTAAATSQITAQRYRAKKAADLINAGRCPDALQAAFNEGDGYLAVRIAQVCELPVPMERAKGPPF
ncbi:hypothetical protein [Caulobacter segnis]|uniref:hypothetical protein n=1 Tax=Caulobacter segnis TaxID=88688 RepID=UPI001CBCF4A3|nr:hypothetical protein [Caulobacter segnis]UAL09467.1 hypothetical protein K8940_17025 [Caulobacter segnis]